MIKTGDASMGEVVDATRDIAISVLELANTEGVHRIQLLSLALGLTGAERCAALLWLWEEHWQFLVLSRYTSNVVDDAVPKELLDQVAVPFVKGARCPIDPNRWALGKAHQPKISEWANRHGFGNYELVLPVILDQKTPDHQPRAVAFVQFLSSSAIPAKTRRDIQVVCGGLALLLTRSRDARRLEAIQELVQAEQRGKQIKDWLEIAADKLIHITNAEAAMIFRETPEGYDAIVTRGKSKPNRRVLASPKSVVTRVAVLRDPVRLRDFEDKAERVAAFRTAEHDLELHRVMEEDLLEGRVRSVLLAPVVFEGHTLAVIALVNKKARVHLARIFSETDQEVLRNVCGFLKGVLPSIELYEALAAMAKVVSPQTLEDPAEGQKVYEVLRQMIPAITGVALIRRHRFETEYAIEMFGGRLSGSEAASLIRVTNQLRRVPDSEHRYITRPVPELPDHYLTVELNRETITGYENQILMFFAKALSHILLAEQGREHVIENFAELRHAVRSGITGVVGYVNESLGCFELYRGLDYAPSVLSQARFRKALERANFAAKKSAHLLEESRFLLSNITRESLKLSNHSLAAVAVGVLNTLRPYAEERRIEISWNNQLVQTSDIAEFDRALVELVMFNIIENAIKYSYRNKIVRVSLTGTRDDWQLTVMDIGTPILEQDMEVIFLPFTRRPRGQAAEQRPGTGLGLAVARQIVRAHDGDVTCSSVPIGKDATEIIFIVSFPRSLRRRTD